MSCVSMPRKATLPLTSPYTDWNAGISRRHGLHHDAKKLLTRGRPRKCFSATASCGSRSPLIANAGAPPEDRVTFAEPAVVSDEVKAERRPAAVADTAAMVTSHLRIRRRAR